VGKPAVIHDDQCERAVFTSRRVHKIFHEALLNSGVPAWKAAVMYAVVEAFGPQWDVPGGPVRTPKFVEGTFRLILRGLSRREYVEVRRYYQYDRETETVAKMRRGGKRLTGSSQDADTVLSVLANVSRIPPELHEELAQTGEVRF
jgi:hypothetical protein